MTKWPHLCLALLLNMALPVLCQSVKPPLTTIDTECDTQRLTQILTTAANPTAARIAAAKRLAMLCMPSTVPTLIAALGDTEPMIRMHAARALGIIGDPAAVLPVSQAVKDNAFSVRLTAVTALGRLGDPRALDTLIAALEDKDQRIQCEAVIALGRIDDLKSTAALQQMAKKDGAAGSQALLALARRDDNSIIPLCMARAEAKDFYDQAIADALMELGDPQAAEVMFKLVEHPKGDIRYSACMGLVRTRDAKILDRLCNLLRSRMKDPQQYGSVAGIVNSALYALPAREAVRILQSWLRDSDRQVAGVAARVLANQYDYQAAGLLDLIQHSEGVHPWTQSAWLSIRQPGIEVTRALWQNSSPELTNTLAEARNWRDSRQAAELFPYQDRQVMWTWRPQRGGWVTSHELYQRLLTETDAMGYLPYIGKLRYCGNHAISQSIRTYMLSISDPMRVYDCCETLKMMADPCAIPDLLKIAERTDWFARNGAEQGLAGCADPRHQETYKLLLRSLKSQLPEVRRAAALTLGSARDARAVPALIESLKSEVDFTARAYCAQALGSIGDKRAVQPLMQTLADLKFSFNAANALGQIGDKTALPAIRLLADQYDPDSHALVSILRIQAMLGDSDAVIRLVDHTRNQENDNLPAFTYHVLVECTSPRISGMALASVWEFDDLSLIGTAGYQHMTQPIHPLLCSLRESRGRYARQEAAYALSVICRNQMGEQTTRVIEALYRTSIHDLDPSVRADAAFALARLRDPRAAERIGAVMQEYIPERNAAIRALWELDTTEANALLTLALEDDDPLGRVLAARGLALHKVPIAAQALKLQVTTITEPTALQLAIRFSADLHDPALVPLYTRYARAQHETAKMPLVLEAIAALGTCGGTTATDVLVELLKSPVTPIREAAARALTGTTNPKARTELRTLLLAEDATRVKEAVEAALGKAK